MKTKKLTAFIAAAVVWIAAAGCGTEEPEATETPTIHVEDTKQEDIPAGEDTPQEAQAEGSASQEETQTETDTFTDSGEHDQEYLPGKVRTINDDSVIISKTILEGDGQVYVPEKGSADEILVTVRFADDADFEHWTIQGGGAEIERRDASFSDITQDSGLEMYGYYEGDVFIAQKVIIEIDV